MKAFKLLKKMVRWYFEQSAKTYAYLPSGMLPYIGQ